MRDRLHFVRRAMSEGWDWLVGVTDHIGRLLTVVALVVGLPAGLALVALGWWAVAVGVALLVLLVFFEGAFRVWHGLDREINPDFPRHAMKIDPPFSVELADTPTSGNTARVLFLPITFTNREPTRRLSLECELLWIARWPTGDVLGPHKVSAFRHAAIERALTSPIAVEPESTVVGYLQFDVAWEFAFEFDRELIGVSMKKWFSLALRVTDHVTGAMIERPVETRELPEQAESEAPSAKP